ncbi:protein jag [Virgibacillus phasianinus]|uniref:RNA-binding protein KhpB n=1 Tax=Virgibacillus phasianinus TaxID=2017483 RepID=A0A220U0X6_9BACI|nr:RNA-binding cell elongation regulator Jag/EloR [Virgibacillus phasianinus]ASK61767.1 protein jag [Virgibacillus phasianinus]
MREITATGQTVEEAIQSALEQLNTTRDQVEIAIIDEGKKGFFGVFGSKRSIVKVIMAKNQIQQAEQYVLELTKNMGVEVEIAATVEGNHVSIEMNGEKIALLIGKRGQTLNALQYLVHLVLNKDGKQFYTVTVDAEGYRGRRKETLESLAVKMADKAKRLNKKVALEPMPAYERKIIHSALQGVKEISTYSDGVEPHRHIVIKP